MKQIVLFLLFVLIASCSSQPHVKRSSTEDDIREAVFRYQFDIWKNHKTGSYYLSIGKEEADPSDEFLERFVENVPRVRRFSACSTANMRVVDKQTGESGLVFRVGSIRWISDTQVEVKGGYYENGLSASGNTYTLIKRNNKWHMEKDKTNWIS